jgi:hypothetical protein
MAFLNALAWFGGLSVGLLLFLSGVVGLIVYIVAIREDKQ